MIIKSIGLCGQAFYVEQQLCHPPDVTNSVCTGFDRIPSNVHKDAFLLNDPNFFF